MSLPPFFTSSDVAYLRGIFFSSWILSFSSQTYYFSWKIKPNDEQTWREYRHLFFFLNLVSILTIIFLYPTWFFFRCWVCEPVLIFMVGIIDMWMDRSVFLPCLQWWIILVCSRCFWTCYPVSFLTGASFWQMIAAGHGVLSQVPIFPECLDVIILETTTWLMSLALRSSAQREPSLAYQTPSLKMVECQRTRWMDICVSYALRIE